MKYMLKEEIVDKLENLSKINPEKFLTMLNFILANMLQDYIVIEREKYTI